MGLTATENGGSDFAITPEGVYVARCYRIIDLGTQKPSNPTYKDAHKAMLSWELLDEPRMEDGKPFSAHQTYTVSLNEKALLRAHLESWRGKVFTNDELLGFDLTNVLGAYCMIQILHDETGKFANVKTIMPLKGEKPKPVNPDVLFDIDNPNMEVFENLSENMKTKIMGAPEWKQAATPAPAKKFDETKDSSNGVEQSAPTKPDVVHEVLESEPIDLNDIPF